MKVAIGIAQRPLEAVRPQSESIRESPSESIRVIPSEGNPMHSDTIRGNQRYSEALRCKHTPAAAQSSEPSTRSV
jgi:hypothetical protein